MWKMLIFILVGQYTFAMPENVVVLAPVLAEWTAEMVGEKEALLHIKGVTEYSSYPSYLKSVPVVGPYPQLKIEMIASMKPDLVIASREYNRPDQVEKLRQLNLKVHILPREEFNTMPAWIRSLAQALGEEKKGELAVKKWVDGLAALSKHAANRGPRPLVRYFLQVQQDPLIAVGGPSFLNDAFQKIGYQNVFGDLAQAYPKVSKEAVLKRDPDEILVLDLTGNKEDSGRALAEWKKYPAMKAVKNGKLRLIPGDDTARCSLRLLSALKIICDLRVNH